MSADKLREAVELAERAVHPDAINTASAYQRAQTLALIDIAQSLRRLIGEDL